MIVSLSLAASMRLGLDDLLRAKDVSVHNVCISLNMTYYIEVDMYIQK